MFQFTTTTVINSNLDSNGSTAKYTGAATYFQVTRVGKFLTDKIVPTLVTTDANLRTKVDGNRYGNKSKVRMEIRYGFNNSIFTLSKVYVDYVKAPKYVTLTQDQIDTYTDSSQVLEFPDYVCQEILNELVNIVMEYSSDPRLQTHIPISQSISQVGQAQPK